MNYYVVKVLRLVICIFIIITLNFLIPRLMPGNPVVMLLGQDVAALTQQDYAELAREYGLEKTLPMQYKEYLHSLWQGELGYSYYYRQPVAELIQRHLGWTLLLLAPALVLSSLIALFAGCLAGWRPGSRQDILSTLGTLAIYAMPQFLLAMILLSIFGFHFSLFPMGGLHSGSSTGSLALIADVAWHLALPVTVLTLSATSTKFLIMRNTVAAACHEDYVMYALAKGINEKRILFVHVLRNACLPLLNLIALNLGFIVSGALLVEVVFSINGMGTLIYQSAITRDYPVLQGCFLVLTLVVIGANTLVDIIAGLLDPRVRA